MPRRPLIALLTTLAALATASVAGAITINGTVTAGATLTATSTNTPSFSLTLNGVDQTPTYTFGISVVDARGIASGSPGGWNLTVTSTTFNDGAGHTFPTNASTITGVATACGANSTCTAPTNAIANTNLSVPAAAVAPAPVKYENASSGTGLGTNTITATVQVAVPSNVFAGTYSSTVTVAIAATP
ncbi:MAG TPA: hypothetical protein VNH45_00425 [Gaiellaceae bacterium]|jgi:hypothetical protein|nr:hypothetical protein [Gaiellaceae bacterium]